MAIDLSGIAEWLHGWFPYHSEVVAKNQTSANASKNVVTNSSGEVTTENKVSVGSGLAFDGSVANKINHSNSVTAQTSAVFKKIKYDAQGHITGTADVQVTDFPHSHNATGVLDANAHSNLGTSASANQGTINTAIDTAIGNLQSIRAIEIVTELDDPVTEANMGKLYIISENSKVNVYYAVKSGTSPNYTYSWHKMDTDILDEYSVAWNDVTGKPSSFPPSSHSHGNISVNGELTNITGDIEYSPLGVLGIDPFTDYIVGYNKFPIKFFVDKYSHSNIGSSANATQDAINTAIDTALGNKLSATKVTSWSNTTSDSNVPSEKLVKGSLDGKADKSGGVQQITDANAHSNIGSSANATQSTINTNIDTALGNKASASHTHGNVTNDGKIGSNTDSGKIVTTTTNGALAVSSDLSTNVIKDPNGHMAIDTIINDTQSTINSKIASAISSLRGGLSDRAVFYVNSASIPEDSDYGYSEIYVTTDTGHTRVYYWDAITTPGVLGVSYELEYFELSNVGESITSIELVPKSSDSTGAIRLYYGDET